MDENENEHTQITGQNPEAPIKQEVQESEDEIPTEEFVTEEDNAEFQDEVSDLLGSENELSTPPEEEEETFQHENVENIEFETEILDEEAKHVVADEENNEIIGDQTENLETANYNEENPQESLEDLQSTGEYAGTKTVVTDMVSKKKKPKLLNKFDKTIKAEIDEAEKLRKKGRSEDAVRAFEDLVIRYPHSPRARYGKAQAQDDLAEKLRSNEVLKTAINTYGRLRGALVTLEKLVQLFPDDVSLKNDLGVGFLLLGDNKNAKKVYEEVLAASPEDGFAKVHYGFILKAENLIAESIPYLKAYKWYEIGHQKGHFASVWQRSLYNVNGLKAQPWWTAKDTGYTDLVKALERNWRMIRDEALAVMDSESGMFLPEDENLREKGEWGQFTLWQQGKTMEYIKYSVMHPGTHVWPHTGPTNCRLRMHLGLVIPKEGCRIRCANDTSAYTPQVGCAMDEKKDFWSELDEVMDSVPKGQKVVIGADFPLVKGTEETRR
ncbi:ASPH hydroxylase, partial [Polypterus senegalus]